MRRLAILGASGHGKVVAELAELCGWSEIVFFDDIRFAQKYFTKWPIEGNSTDFFSNASQFDGIHLAIGDNMVRYKIFKRHNMLNIISLIHPSAVIASSAAIGAGVAINANVVVNSSVCIGKGTILNTACTIDHDCFLGDFVHISPGSHLAGNVSVGKRSWVGVGANIIQGISIGNDVVIGAGSTVISDIPEGTTAVGTPCKVIKTSEGLF